MLISQFSDAVFIAKLIDFIIFVAAIVWAFNKWGKPALVAHQHAQNKSVEDAVAERERRALTVEQARQAIEQAKSDSVRMVHVGQAQVQHLLESERQAALAHAERIRAHASGELDRERYRVRRELLEDTVERAHTRATEIARTEISSEKQHRLVEQLIANLEHARA